MSESRLAKPQDLKRLNDAAEAAGYNRQISTKAINSLDPEGFNIVTPVLYHEHAGGVKVDPHMRCSVLMKFKGKSDPERVYLDVSFDNLETLPLARPLMEDVANAKADAE